MFKRIGLFALLIFGVTGALLPATALAQDGYYGRPNYYYQGDRDWDRHQRHEWREHERRERRAYEWREPRWREHEWREHERREHRWNRGYYPDSYFYFGYQR